MNLLTRTLFPALAMLGLAITAAAAGWESIEKLPGHDAVTVTVRKRPRTYFRLTPRAPLTVTVSGPARLRVISRAVLTERPEGEAAYQIVALEGEQALRAADERAGAARGVKAEGVAALGAGRRMIVEVPAGTHAIRLVLTGLREVLVRLQRAEPARAPIEWVSLTPVRASRSVSVIEGEKSIAYYSILPDRPVVLRVVGPSTLDCITRLDYEPAMIGAQAYRLRVVEHGRTLRTLDFHTTKSGAATYTGLEHRVPSKFDRFSLAVGGGLHEIEFHLVRPARGSAEIHARIPAPSVGNQP